MKKSANKIAAAAQTPVFPKTPHRLRPNSKEAAANPNLKKRDNVFSKSRDKREDRGTREIKTSDKPHSVFQVF
jgi:hypothetical protein